jgi:DNA-binding response OmpR family regulator
MSEQAVVLVADDDPDILQLVTLRLEGAGYRVVQAVDGDEALRLAQESKPDLAVLDVTMPKLTGYDVTRALREHDATRDIPVILLTARVQDTDFEEGYAAGADDYLTKPFSPEDLAARVGALLAGN